MGSPVSRRLRSFGGLFRDALSDSGLLLGDMVTRVQRGGKGVVHPVLILLTTGLFNGMYPTALRTTITLRLLRGTDLIRSSMISRDARHHKRLSIGTVFGGGMTMLTNSCLLTATLIRINVAHGRSVVSVISYLKRSLTSNRLLRLSGIDGLRFSRRICFSIVHGGATILFTTYAGTNTLSIKTDSRGTRSTHLFNRCVKLYFRVGSSVFSCSRDGRVNGPAKGSVIRKGLALPTLRILGAIGSGATRRVTMGVGGKRTAPNRVTRLVRFAGRGNNVRCTSRIVCSCGRGTLSLLTSLPSARMGMTLTKCLSCIMRQRG